jgi:heme/copper-type cytochrome/quinol oxidase subunit 3
MATPMLALESGEKKTDPHLATFGVLVLAVSVIVAFGALLGAWLSLKSGGVPWSPKGYTIQNYYGETLSVTMVLGATAAEWAAYGVRKRERGQAITGLVLVVLLGLAFLNLLTYVVRVSHVSPATSAYGAVYFAFNLLLISSVVLGLGLALVTLARLLGGQVSAAEPSLVRSTAWFWDAVTVGWFVVYAAVYLVK